MEGYNIDLELGCRYTVSVILSNKFILTSTGLRFIKVTPKGFNFLDDDKNKCVFNSHFYRSNKTKKFFIPKKIIIRKEN